MFLVRSSCFDSRWRCSRFGPLCLSAFLTLLLCAGGRGQTTQPSPNPTRQRAEAQVKLTSARLARDKDLAAAGEGFLKAHQLDPTYPLPLLYLGGIAQKQEHWDAAIGYYEEFCKLDDKSDLYVDTQLRLDQVRRFAEQDKTPVGKRTRQYDAALTQAKARIAAGKLDEAAEASKQLIAADPQRWEGHSLRGDLLMRRGAYQDALAPLSQSLPLAPTDKRPAIEEALKRCTVEANAAKAAELVKAGDHAAAAKIYADLYQASPDKEQIGMSAAMAYGVAGKYAESADLLFRLERSKDPITAHQATERLVTLRPLLAHQSEQFARVEARLAGEAAAGAKMARESEIARLLSVAKANDNREHAKVASAAIADLFKLDPANVEALKLREKISGYYGPSKVGDAITNTVGMKLAYIPSGEFTMGSLSGEDGSQHRVTLTKPFMMQTTPVTQAQYWSVMDHKNPSLHQRPQFDTPCENRPVECVSWNDAVEFCRRLGQQEGKHYRLPTEAEWEWACRAGTTTAFWFGDDEGKLADHDWFDGNSGRVTHPVGELGANAWGLCDMHGNVQQWCSDYYGDYPAGDATNPTGPEQGSWRVLRGGSCNYPPLLCRAAFRVRMTPDSPCGFFGFRVCLDF